MIFSMDVSHYPDIGSYSGFPVESILQQEIDSPVEKIFQQGSGSHSEPQEKAPTFPGSSPIKNMTLVPDCQLSTGVGASLPHDRAIRISSREKAGMPDTMHEDE
jgi:hypothetical protein